MRIESNRFIHRYVCTPSVLEIKLRFKFIFQIVSKYTGCYCSDFFAMKVKLFVMICLTIILLYALSLPARIMPYFVIAVISYFPIK